MIDTLQIAKDLEASFTPEQASALVKALARPLTAELVTKQDLTFETTGIRQEMALLKADLKAEIATLRTEQKQDIAGLKPKPSNGSPARWLSICWAPRAWC